MVKKENRFSGLVEELTILWLEWMQLNEVTIDYTKSAAERKQTAIKQEQLIDKRYGIIKNINDFFKTEQSD